MEQILFHWRDDRDLRHAPWCARYSRLMARDLDDGKFGQGRVWCDVGRAGMSSFVPQLIVVLITDPLNTVAVFIRRMRRRNSGQSVAQRRPGGSSDYGRSKPQLHPIVPTWSAAIAVHLPWRIASWSCTQRRDICRPVRAGDRYVRSSGTQSRTDSEDIERVLTATLVF